MPPDQPIRTLAVLLGASEFPYAPHLADGRAFTLSAADVRRYFQDEKGLALPRENVFSLFDDTSSQSDQLMKLTSFLKRRIAELKDAGSPPTQLLLYYVGHGLFTRGDRAYCLAVRSTNEFNEGATSIRAQDLVETIRGSATHLRNYWILDCCFAGKIVSEFQSGVLTAVREQILGDGPNRGSAVLCSSNSRETSLAPQGLDHTMFSEAMLTALRAGHPGAGPRLSLRDLGDLVSENLHAAWKDTWVRPEVHSPDMREGDIAHLPLFPNPAYIPPEERASEEEDQKRKAAAKAAEERAREQERMAAAKAEEKRVAAAKAEEDRVAAAKAAELIARKKSEQVRMAAVKAKAAAAKAEEESLAEAKAAEERAARQAEAKKLAAEKAAKERARKRAEEARIAQQQAAVERARQQEEENKKEARKKLTEPAPKRPQPELNATETAAREQFHKKAEEERVESEERARKKSQAYRIATEKLKQGPPFEPATPSSKMSTVNAKASPFLSITAEPATETAKSSDMDAWAIFLMLLWVILPNVAGFFAGRYMALHFNDPVPNVFMRVGLGLGAWASLPAYGFLAGVISRTALKKLEAFDELRWFACVHWIGFLLGFRFFNGLLPEGQPSIWLAIAGIVVFLLTAMIGK